MALCGAALTGFGYSLVFPALGVEAVERVPVENRGTALSVYTVFADVSFFMVGPVAGAVIGAFGYASVFLFALALRPRSPRHRPRPRQEENRTPFSRPPTEMHIDAVNRTQHSRLVIDRAKRR